MKTKPVVVIMLLALGLSACSGDLPTITGEVEQEYQYLVSIREVQQACTTGRWFPACDIRSEDSVLTMWALRYIEENDYDGAACDGSGGDEPPEGTRVHAGDQVEVHNAAGVIVGLTTLRAGIAEAQHGGGLDPVNVSVICRLTFEVDLTEESEFYSITAGGKAGPTYSADELAAQEWHVSLR